MRASIFSVNDHHPRLARTVPELYAQVIEAFEGKRQTQGSKGFMARADKAAPACECGSTLPKRTRRIRATASEAPRGEHGDP